MNNRPLWRKAYDAIEGELAPRIEALIRDEKFLRRGGAVARGRKRLRERIDRTSARLWHLLNLPAGSDVRRLRKQIGELDRELRLLTLHLERAQKRNRAASGQGSRNEKAVNERS